MKSRKGRQEVKHAEKLERMEVLKANSFPPLHRSSRHNQGPCIYLLGKCHWAKSANNIKWTRCLSRQRYLPHKPDDLSWIARAHSKKRAPKFVFSFPRVCCGTFVCPHTVFNWCGTHMGYHHVKHLDPQVSKISISVDRILEVTPGHHTVDYSTEDCVTPFVLYFVMWKRISTN